MSRRRKKEEEHENLERWMVSYADFVTLLFAFFTCLYAISTVDAGKMEQMVASMRESFGGQIFEGGSRTLTLLDGGVGGTSISSAVLINPEFDADDPAGLEAAKRDPSAKVILSGDAAMGRFRRTLEGLLNEEIKNNMIRIQLSERGIIISLAEARMFDSGSDVIKPGGISSLDTIATSLTSIGNHIRIEGHADSVPIHTVRFPSNWDLSVARASTVLRRMETIYGMSPKLLSAAGFGEHRPTASNDTEEGRALNRRVDIVILNPSYARLDPQ